MLNLLPKKYGLVLLVLLPILTAAVGIIWLTDDLINLVTTDANKAEHHRNHKVLETAMSSMKDELASIATDNGNWNDAVRHSYGDIDFSWIEETWAVSATLDGNPFDAVFVVDGVSRKVLVGYLDNKRIEKIPEHPFGPGIDKVFDHLEAEGNTGEQAIFTNSFIGPAAVGVAQIVPTSTDVKIPSSKPNYIVLLHDLSRANLAELGSKFGIDGVKVVNPAKADRDDLTISDNLGQTVAFISWSDKDAGSVAIAGVWHRSLVVLSFLLLLMGGIAALCILLIKRIIRNESDAKHRALHDTLTGLRNRAGFSSAFAKFGDRPNKTVALAFIDLDGFKSVNDSFGHLVGDRLIQEIAKGINQVADRPEIVGRMGGDEFAVLFHGEDARARAEQFAEIIVRFVSKPFDFEGRVASVGASVGIVTVDDPNIDDEELLRRADMAMYMAKAQGKNRYCHFDPAQDSGRIENNSIASELKTYIETDSLDVAFQPIVASDSMQVTGAEVLARWPRSSSRNLGPDQFIGVAETFGLIDQLGLCVLRKACSFAKNWPGLKIAVNISPLQLNNPYFLPQVRATINKAGIKPQQLNFEITESVLINDVERAQSIFEDLREFGIGVVLDDFGSGFSSIGYLRRFCFDGIKIDRGLVRDVTAGAKNLEVLQGIMLLAKGFSTNVTAEGVEDLVQVSVLRLAGCQLLQGYGIHKPMPEHEFGKVALGLAA